MAITIVVENVDMNMLQEQYNLLQEVYNEGDNELTPEQNKAFEGLCSLLDSIFIDNLDQYPQASEPWKCEICGTTGEGMHFPDCTSDMK